jgi:hypothetical protein
MGFTLIPSLSAIRWAKSSSLQSASWARTVGRAAGRAAGPESSSSTSRLATSGLETLETLGTLESQEANPGRPPPPPTVAQGRRSAENRPRAWNPLGAPPASLPQNGSLNVLFRRSLASLAPYWLRLATKRLNRQAKQGLPGVSPANENYPFEGTWLEARSHPDGPPPPNAPPRRKTPHPFRSAHLHAPGGRRAGRRSWPHLGGWPRDCDKRCAKEEGIQAQPVDL